MFYKNKDGNWFTASIIKLPNGVILSAENRENDLDWIWYDEEPEAFTEWKNEQLKFDK